jgi:hypothetical protein
MLSVVIFAGALVAVRVIVEPCKGCLQPVDPGKRWSMVKVIGYRVWGSSTSENERQLGKSSDQQLPKSRSSPLFFTSHISPPLPQNGPFGWQNFRWSSVQALPKC